MPLGALVLSLADCKQLLGMRYAEWSIRAPSLEADIAAAAMGLDDIGHSRVLLGCLMPLGDDPRGPEREAGPEGYRNLAYFDRPFDSWAHFVAANAVLDTAFTVFIEACVEGDVEVLRARLRKMLQEERYHFLHGRSWLRAGVDETPLTEAWREAVEWFGPPGGDVDQLHRAGALSRDSARLRARLEERLEQPAPESAAAVDWDAWDPVRRRTRPGALDERTYAMLRGLEEKKYAANL
ncbi:MAG: phenylacetate-CoA oxygenase subunit PaaI [Candidatus Dormibacteraeota bacterium]|nr:phenylacetate-CoA oxygenase subunit PaaI [Candidatus Dormibacteraeota bacterium]